MPYLSMTRLKLKSLGYMLPFAVHTERVVRQICASKGFLKGKLLGTHDLAMWTATLWVSEEAAKVFYVSGAHRTVMPKLWEWSTEAASGQQVLDTQDLPSWEQIRQQLCCIGYFPPLQEPSSDHKNRVIACPRFVVFVRSLTPSKNV